MRLSQARLLLLPLLGAIAAPPLAAQSLTVYAPVVSVTRSDTSLPRLQSKSLRSRLDFLNASAVGQSVYVSTRWGPCGQGFIATDPLFVPSGGTVSFGAPETPDCPGDYVGIVAVPLAAGVVVSSTLERTYEFACDASCAGAGAGTASISVGEIPLPVFEGLVRAGQEAVSGSVPLFNEAAYPTCGIEGRLYPRRVNLTVFNAGAGIATIALRATARGGTLLDQIYHVPPNSVAQFNGLSVGDPQVCRGDGQAPVSRVFFRATADQPSVAWISTTFDADVPDSVRYGFFPLRPAVDESLDSPLANGRWTGQGACLSVTDAGCDLVVGCGHGQFPRPVIRADGTFDVDGTYRIEAGPASGNPAPPAHFSGSVAGKALTVTVVPSATPPPATYTMDSAAPGGCPVPCV